MPLEWALPTFKCMSCRRPRLAIVSTRTSSCHGWVNSLSIRLHLAACAACLGLVACVSDAAAPVASSWQLTLGVSGGFAGFDQTFTTASGSDTLLAQDRRRGTGATVALSIEEQRELQRLVASLAQSPGADLRSGKCRDCFQFELTIASAATGKPRLSIHDSTTLEGSPDASLVERVITIGRGGLSRQQNQ